ncbi:hypoxanthine phosphoribosyltransferase [Effusibacillus lacus]|uniref:Hypoxanthine phosphoribosyltransferase n=1 Tax=Effusibacillus lacus TaxID=1348429 RepID=A0A292YJH6_9BACL|nr:hypoxanthine phosphoribosyltransferase [Effusibacillus lacus]TCS74485.1 hypoxanthine phosphoribosyltransferase [Effusibacillus lacus]GAX88645.1 hypoxanthine phosphoribosyltransferase [Effusibacillus lacus]
MHNDIKHILFTEEQIQNRIGELGARIAQDYADKNPLVICVLKGAVLFMSDLVKRIEVPLEMDFMAISSYGVSTKSSGVVRILKDLETGVEGRHVLIVEDIVDTGLTLSYLRDSLLRRDAASVRIVTLFNKPSGRKIEITPDYSGFEVPDEFIVGYGLDYAEKYRNLPYVGVLKPEIYS